MEFSTSSHSWTDDVHGLHATHGELVAVTAEGADHPSCGPIAALLDRMRRVLALDVVFVALFADGCPAYRQWRTLGPEGLDETDCDGAELDLAKQIVSDRSDCGGTVRLHFLARPVISKDGREFGTVCCRKAPTESESERDAGALQSIARLIAVTLCRTEKDLSPVWERSDSAVLGLA